MTLQQARALLARSKYPDNPDWLYKMGIGGMVNSKEMAVIFGLESTSSVLGSARAGCLPEPDVKPPRQAASFTGNTCQWYAPTVIAEIQRRRRIWHEAEAVVEAARGQAA